MNVFTIDMLEVEKIPSLPLITLNGTLLKSEVIDQPIIAIAPNSISESSVAPPPVVQTQLVNVPIAPAPPLLTSTPLATTKRPKRGFRTYLNTKKLNRSPLKPATLIARPSNTPTVFPNSQQQQSVILGSSIAPVIQNTLPAVTPSGFTTYLVVDGNQGQFVQVANDGPKPVTFRNQTGQLLQATPITVVSTTNQPAVPSFPVNGDCSLVSNSSQTITTVRTSSSIDVQQQTTLTSDTTTTQQLSSVMHQPTIINGNNCHTFENKSSLDQSKTSSNNLSLSLSQIAQKVSHRHRRSSSSSTSKKKRGRPRLYERDPFTNKPIRSDVTPASTESIIPTVKNTTLLVPGQTTTFTTLPSHMNGCNSLIFPNQPVTNPSLLQQHQYSYPSLLNGTSSSSHILVSPTFNAFPNNANTVLSSTTYPYSSQPIIKEYAQPSHAPQIPSTINLNSSPRKCANDDVAVHYIGGFVIRESNQPFSSSNNNHVQEQLRCVVCQKLDLSPNFFDPEKKFCSKFCSLKSNNSPIRMFDNPIPEPVVEASIDEQEPLPPDHDLPTDPSKWTVSQVGEFVARLTNETIREAFYECEMDGQALLLMTQEHLRDTMKIKLGPSLIIASEIAKLRERSKTISS